jgi:hypothetical protein
LPQDFVGYYPTMFPAGYNHPYMMPQYATGQWGAQAAGSLPGVVNNGHGTVTTLPGPSYLLPGQNDNTNSLIRQFNRNADEQVAMAPNNLRTIGMPPTATTRPLSDTQYPSIYPWLLYCDRHPHRGGDDLTNLGPKFEKEGFRYISQLSRARVSIEQLSKWLGIGKGIADLLLQYAESDVELVHAGMFSMEDPIADGLVTL